MINAENVYKYVSPYLIIPKGTNIIHNYGVIKINLFILLLPGFPLPFKELVHHISRLKCVMVCIPTQGT